MIYGHFFKLDRDSLLSKGQVIFRYLPVRYERYNGKDEYPHYPVYAVLSRHAVDFFYHGQDQKKDSENDRHHVHIRLLHLPLSPNLSVKDNLTSILQNDVYNHNYQILPEYKTDSENSNIKTYSNLKVFELEEIKKDEIYFRKLLLDFIYDLEHTHVFENSPYYEEAEVRLRENFMFNAIAAKAAYYWARDNWTQNQAVNNNIYAENLAEAEKQWLRMLRYEQNCNYGSYSGGWFKNVEEEYKDVVFPNSPFNRYDWRKKLEEDLESNRSKDSHAKDDNVNITRESVRWFLRRYSFGNSLRVLMSLSKWRAIVFVSAEAFLFIILPMILNGYLKYSVLNYLLLYMCGIVFLSILLPVLFICKLALPVLGMLMPRLIMAISSAWILFTTTEEIYKSSFDMTFSTGWWVVLLIIPVMLFMMLEIRNIAPDVNFPSICCRCLVILGIGFIYSLLIGMFFINFTAKRILPRSGYLPTFYYELNKDEDKDKKAIQWENPYEGDSLQKLKATLSTKLYSDLKEVHPKSNEVCPILSECPVLLEIEMKILKTFCFHLDVLPRMLFSKAIFALFIGIFIQLIFEDKPITEPL
jgi:hypothetical protein